MGTRVKYITVPFYRFTTSVADALGTLYHSAILKRDCEHIDRLIKEYELTPAQTDEPWEPVVKSMARL